MYLFDGDRSCKKEVILCYTFDVFVDFLVNVCRTIVIVNSVLCIKVDEGTPRQDQLF